ncbi:succinate dehydrogenase/fumarate reductase iron-sulfur subunit [Vulgatibacter incomptus]|uniref:Succinate dehydrogenase iron-sulfur protein n=1 Tax=Vulgatibacter incomptus TaxID=1391653 RepID=A0A0K1PD15_9BACT|nr:succinate dehydrogenase/fumarate reductase iron-sulfur subunit [Vulgatibacter incomptus]AKU91014.1 Succinate dehydrogenase iron-sulfur protein [Vulgatibacter incomptus]
MSAGTMKLKLRVWRQKNGNTPGKMIDYLAEDVSPDMSFLEMLDVVNEKLEAKGDEPIAFDHDCREGICGTCSLVIDGQAHGPIPGVTTCQLHMRSFRDGQEVTIEPFRAAAFPVVKDLVVNRGAFDKVVAAGGFVSVRTGGTPDGNAIPISKEEADLSMDAAACIGCGACVAACPNASAMLFVGAQISKYKHLPQGQVERTSRANGMIAEMDAQGFGNCTNHRECEAVCPKEIPIRVIAELNREFIRAKSKGKRVAGKSDGA